MTAPTHTVSSAPSNWIQQLQGQVGFIRTRVNKLDRDGDPQDNIILCENHLNRLSEAVRVAVSSIMHSLAH